MALYDTKTYKADVGEHEISFDFDRSGVIVNRGRLFVDGKQVDDRAVFWGDSAVSGELSDGRSFKVEFGSGFVGQLKKLELVVGDERIDLRHTDPDDPPST